MRALWFCALVVCSIGGPFHIVYLAAWLHLVGATTLGAIAKRQRQRAAASATDDVADAAFQTQLAVLVLTSVVAIANGTTVHRRTRTGCVVARARDGVRAD